MADDSDTTEPIQCYGLPGSGAVHILEEMPGKKVERAD